MTITIEAVARTALSGQALELRALAQEFLRENQDLRLCQKPVSTDARVLAVAGLVELFALRAAQSPPDWASTVKSAPKEIFLVKGLVAGGYTERLCRAESPEPLKKRRLYATLNFFGIRLARGDGATTSIRPNFADWKPA